MILTLGTTLAVARSMTFDRVTLDSVNRTSDVLVRAAGKSVNAARAIRALGGEVVCLGIGGGETGETLRRDLDSIGIAHDLVDIPEPTRVCVTVIDRATGQATELVQEAPPVTQGDLSALIDRYEKHLKRARVVLLAGTLAPGVPDDFYAECVSRANAAGVMTVVDAKGKALRLAIERKPTVVKPNRRELAETFGFDLDDTMATPTIVADLAGRQGVKVVATDGPRAIFVGDGEHEWRITPPPAAVVSPIGSGDSLAGGLAHALHDGQPFADAVRLGIACAASNAESPVAGQIDSARVAALLRDLL